MKKRQFDFTLLTNLLPPIIARKDIGKYLGGLFTSAYLANLDCKGEGPASFKSGSNVAYLREDLISWLSSRANEQKEGENVELNTHD